MLEKGVALWPMVPVVTAQWSNGRLQLQSCGSGSSRSLFFYKNTGNEFEDVPNKCAVCLGW